MEFLRNGKKVMNRPTLFFFLCLCSYFNSYAQQDSIVQNIPFLKEQLGYQMEYLNLNVCSLKFEIIDTVRMGTESTYHLQVTAKASGSAKFLFNLDNIYHSYFNASTFLPSKTVKKIKQKNIRHIMNIEFNHEQNQAVIIDSVSWEIPYDCFEYFSMLYFLRSQKLAPNDTLHFHLDSEHLISQGCAVVLPDKEKIKTPAGKFQAKKVEIEFNAVNKEPRPWKTDLLTNRLASPNSRLSIWFSDDDLHLPLKISYNQSLIKTKIILNSFKRGQQD